MTYAWYREAACTDPVTQGDIFEDVPVLVFKDQVDSASDPDDVKHKLQKSAGVRTVRAVVMTQACDLEHGHVDHVQLCAAYALSEFKADWQQTQTASGQVPTEKSWKRRADDIRAGRVWNYTMLANHTDGNRQAQDFLIVNFHEIFSLPLGFLGAWVKLRDRKRLQLCPPYREHLSQAFARYFMRVGLPINIQLPA